MTSNSLVNAAVVVTGGAHGIGRAIAERFAYEGARVAIGDVDAEAARAAAAAIGGGAIGGGAIGGAMDVTDGEGFAAFLDAAELRHGPLEVMINNAGVDCIGPFDQEPDEISRREIEVNLVGTVIGSRLAVQRMLPRRHGHLVNIASGVGRVPLPGSSVYSATKHGIVGLTESLRLEYRGSGIRFTLVQPAQVETAMIDGQPRPRMLPVVKPDDVARAVLDAVRNDKFDIWVLASQAITFKLSNLLPRPARESLLRVMGIERLAGEADQAARAGYHDRRFGRA
jgi:NAD(P)-dependent dehydrogenase (short-subunit alcohol dehydrogenase family)